MRALGRGRIGNLSRRGVGKYNVLAAVCSFAIVVTTLMSAGVVINGQKVEDVGAISGSWADYKSDAFTDPGDERYADYEEPPGSSESSPYLIETPEEFACLGNEECYHGSTAGSYTKLANPIDLSAHYWQPIYLCSQVGSGDHCDWHFSDVEEDYWMPGDSDVAYFDGNMQEITGLNIFNGYKRRYVISDATESYGDIYTANAWTTGLFGIIQKARIVNVMLIAPTITLDEIDNTMMVDHVLQGNLFSVGVVAGIARNSRIVNTHVVDPTISYSVDFDENAIYDNWYQQTPARIMVGGIVGYSVESTFVVGGSVKGGSIDVRPVVDEVASEGLKPGSNEAAWGFIADRGVDIGGIVGLNVQSVIMSSCSNTDISFSDAGYSLDQNDNYKIKIGGITGWSNSEHTFQACLYNSCSHSNISADISHFGNSYVGGVVGLLEHDSMINTFFDGEITSSATNNGEIAGGIDNASDSPYVVASNYYMGGGLNAYGVTVDGTNHQSGFATITTAGKLADDLNAGKQQVIEDTLLHTGGQLSNAFVTAAVNAWEVQDEICLMDCVGKLGVGLIFPNNDECTPKPQAPSAPGTLVPDVPNAGLYGASGAYRYGFSV